jgi:pilus assembly protein Flp/PilA
MFAVFRRLLKDNVGASAIEYVLIASFISIAMLFALSGVGSNVSDTFSTIAENL